MAEVGLSFETEGFAGYADAMLVAYLAEEEPDLARVIAELPAEQAEAAALAAAVPIEGETTATIDGCIRKLRYRKINARLKELADEMNTGSDDRAELQQEYVELMEKLKEFK